MIYACVHTKGGVGKTTIAVHLAAHLSMLPAVAPTTLLIDGDPQQSAAAWTVMRREKGLQPSPTMVNLTGRAVYTEGKALAEKFSNVVIDAGGRDSAGLRSALLLAQRAIVPIGASSLDAWAMADLLEVIELARSLNPALELRVLLTRISARTRDTDEMMAFLMREKLPVMEARICERVAFRRAVGEGATVMETGRDQAATMEAEAFFSEVTR
jgi:chromosome partitioning protein